ncbi:hypothetical protein [Streptomyces anulatus]|uniref:T4 family baseplate hub assembly chaperone n=1 Tax=Streptomyces anulatus TaxID=1892 RepID=UPI003426A782
MTEPIVLPEFSSFGDQTISGLDSPEEATAASQSVLQEARNSGRPRINDPGESHLTLHRGICREGAWYRDAEVRELTGADEEAFAAAGTSAPKVFETLLLRGTVRVGGEPMSPKVAAELLIGDREELVVAIRRATFGENLEFERLPCPQCGELVDLTVPLGALPSVSLEDPEQIEFEVPLRHGATAAVRLPTGEDQAAVLAIKSNAARRDSEILGRCVLSVTQPDGAVVRRPPAQTLKMADRQAVLRFLGDTQPGPRLNQFSFTHESCGEEVELPIDLAVLFRGL